MEQSFQFLKKMSTGFLLFLWVVNIGVASARINGYEEHPLSKIAIHKATFAIRDSASIGVRPSALGKKVKLLVYQLISMLNAPV